MYNVPTYTKFGLHRVPRTDHRRKSRTPCIMFGGLWRNEQGNNEFSKLKKMLNSSLIGAGCSAHVLNNCIQEFTSILKII